MKKINIDEINYLKRSVARDEAGLKNAIEAKARKKSERAIKNAEADIAFYEREAKGANEELAALLAEAEEAKKLAAEGGEIVVAFVWLDDYGRIDSEVERSLWNSLEEAEEYYNKIKDGNGGYINAWIEVRNAGEFNRIKAIKAELERLKAELKELGS